MSSGKVDTNLQEKHKSKLEAKSSIEGRNGVNSFKEEDSKKILFELQVGDWSRNPILLHTQ